MTTPTVLDAQTKALVDAITGLQIAVGSLNPDPMQTIAGHRARQARQDRRSRLSLIIAILAVVISAASMVATARGAPLFGILATEKPTSPPPGPWVLWVGGTPAEGSPMIEWTNAIRAFDDHAQCARAWEEAVKLGDSTVPQALQRRGFRWAFSCFPSATHPSGKRG